ncbi:DUF2948 family protein [Pararhodobacter sp.]|uniref:DUF2948 family protein n=1 Tax=Pararhodobacter sp. TaxID=2127056 RepID=UPI002AFED57F|nr:DUF2948 family protein [Pararhodobacter sp.]
MTDARFEDGAERPLRLIARDADDLRVLSALVQDSVLTGADFQYQRARRRFSVLLNRFRWEDQAQAKAAGRRVERVRSVLDFSDVTAVAHQGLERDGETILSLLSIAYVPQVEVGADEPAGPGRVVLTFAGDGALALSVECLEVELSDVTRPYAAPSGKTPSHGD